MSFDDVAKRMKDRHAGENEGAIGQMTHSSGGGGTIAIGVILLIVGIVITVVTHDHASKQGGTYVVAYGPIVYGVITIIRGLAKLGG
jgi:uncharacterized membrane protein